jgi:hypothetical protein
MLLVGALVILIIESPTEYSIPAPHVSVEVATFVDEASGMSFEAQSLSAGAISQTHAQRMATEAFDELLTGPEVTVEVVSGRLTDSEYYYRDAGRKVFPIRNRSVWIAAYRGVRIPSFGEERLPPNRTAFVAVDAYTGEVLEFFSYK